MDFQSPSSGHGSDGSGRVRDLRRNFDVQTTLLHRPRFDVEKLDPRRTTPITIRGTHDSKSVYPSE